MTLPAQAATTPQAVTVTQAVSEIGSLLSSLEEPGSGTEPRQDTKDAEAEEQPAPDESSTEDATTEDADTADDAEQEVTDGEEDEEEAPPGPVTRKVKVDGAEIEVTEDELLRGYSRQADYTRKTQALAKERETFESDRQAVQAERQKYAAMLGRLEQAISEQGPPAGVDWEKLRTEDPLAFAEQWAGHQLHQQRLQAVRDEREATERQLAADHETTLKEHLVQERTKLLDEIPEWKDEAKRSTEKQAMVSYATSIGFTENDLAQVTDHRALILLRKAMLYDNLQKEKTVQKKAIQQKIEKAKVATPGAAGTVKTRAVTDLARANQRLAKTGRVRDAADAVAHLLDAEEKTARRSG